MKVEIISVGTELLQGEVVNTNSKFICERLPLLGLSAVGETTALDNERDIKKALAVALERADIVIITGGLGPTDDDITLSSVCRALGIEQKLNEDCLNDIKEYFKSTGREMPQNNVKQAMLPVGAKVFKNACGTAPGCAISAGGQSIIMLPGVPREMETMFKSQVEEFLSKFGCDAVATKNIRIFGVGESVVSQKIGKELFASENPTLGIYCEPGEVRLRVQAVSDNTVAAEALCRPFTNKIKALFGDAVYSTDGKNLEQTVVALLRENGLTVATAESCTAGLISKRITDVPCSSEVFSMGVAAYSAETKEKVLSVPKSLIDREGTVCKEVAVYMALGVKNKSGADFGVGVTGVAGGSVEGKENGLVYVAVTNGDTYWAKELHIGHGTYDEREYIRIVASSYALDMVRRAILGTAEGGKPLKLKSKEAPIEEKAEPIIEAPVQPVIVEETPTVIKAVESEPKPSKIIETPKKKHKFLSAFFPTADDSAGEIVRKIIVILALLVLIVSCGMLAGHFVNKFNNEHIIDNLRQEYNSSAVGVDQSTGIQTKFIRLFEKNSDIRGWLKINGTEVDTPVYQALDNDYYIDHNAEKERSVYGALFIDYRAQISDTATSKNICIYGHHMNDGSMLAEIHNYKSIDYFKKHPVVEFDSIYHDGDYKVFSAFITNASTADDNGYFFDYTTPNFTSVEHFEKWIDNVKARSLFDTPVDILPSDQILTMSTCTYEIGGTELRFVVCARKVREGESPEVDTTKITSKQDPVFPQVWYDTFGGKKPEGAVENQWYGQVMTDHVNSQMELTESKIESDLLMQSMLAESARLESERVQSELIMSQLVQSMIAESNRLQSEAQMSSGTSTVPSTSTGSAPYYIDENGNFHIDESYLNTLSVFSIVVQQ